MRAAVWLLGLFAAAVALALFAGSNQGTVTVFWPPHRVDVSINLMLLVLLGLFVLLHLALRALAALLELPSQARRWRAQQRERATHALLLDAMTQFLAGRYLRARKAAEGALSRAQSLSEAGDSAPVERASAAWARVSSWAVGDGLVSWGMGAGVGARASAARRLNGPGQIYSDHPLPGLICIKSSRLSDRLVGF